MTTSTTDTTKTSPRKTLRTALSRKAKSIADASRADLDRQIEQIDQEAEERRARIQAEISTRQRLERLRAIATPLDELVERLRRKIRQATHTATHGVHAGHVSSMWTAMPEPEENSFHLDEAREVVMKEIRTGSLMAMKSIDLGDGNFMVAARITGTFPASIEPVAGMVPSEVRKMWRHIADGPRRCWTISGHNPKSVPDIKAAAKSLDAIAKTGLIEVIDAEGLLLVSPGSLIR